jgi:uncharacterized protein YqjF (DUF2071 family)
LPYRLARLHSRFKDGQRQSQVVASDGQLDCHATWNASIASAPAKPNTKTEFLVERYTAFTKLRGITRKFQIAHEPWLLRPAEIEIQNCSLIPWLSDKKIDCAHHSLGLEEVKISAPKRLEDYEP